ncbi:MAG: beta-trefoil DNA-binding domain-containing protein, partial [Linnemannia elongata]
MTTIRCWHGAIAQKSYGIEKRYLCPPPMVQVSAGVNAKQVRSEQPHVTMSVIHEKVDIRGHHGENLMEQDCSLDDALRCSFRNLHVTGTGSDSSKRFKLGLQVFLNKNATMPTAIMDSNPIPIISKPSKKTAKAGNASCFILNGMSVSLLNRINAQTVRTKYMAVDNNAVCAKIGSWSSFTIKMVKPPPAPPPVYVFSNSEPVLYGSEIVLINDLTGIMTDRLIIRKVENGKVSRSGTGPVSQMQKIVLEHPDRVHPEDGRSYYLSASSIGSPKIEGKIPLQAAMDRSPLLDNSMPRRMGKNQDSVAVDDFVCWTIAGIAKFDYTYFGPIPASVDSDVDPTKVPSIQSCPLYNANTNTMTMQVKNVF